MSTAPMSKESVTHLGVKSSYRCAQTLGFDDPLVNAEVCEQATAAVFTAIEDSAFSSSIEYPQVTIIDAMWIHSLLQPQHREILERSVLRFSRQPSDEQLFGIAILNAFDQSYK